MNLQKNLERRPCQVEKWERQWEEEFQVYSEQGMKGES